MAFRASLAQETMLADLRDYHEASGMSLRDVEKQLGWSNGKLSKTLRGLQSVTLDDLNGLMEIYRIPKADRARLRNHRTQSRAKRTWWDEHPWIPANFEKYIATEDAALEIRCLQASVFPGLIQTESYMRELFGTTYPLERQGFFEDGVAVRLNRQRILNKARLSVTVILRESILEEGSPEVLKDQLDHVINLVEESNRLTLRILPRRVLVSYGGMELFTLPGNKRMAASEAPFLGALVFDDSSQVRRAEEMLATYEELSLSPEDGVTLLKQTRGKIK